MKWDEALLQKVEQSLRSDARIDARQIRVHVHSGVVTLTGTVPNALQKQSVEQVLRGIVDCRALVMELALEPASGYVKSDEMLAARIVAALSQVMHLPVDRVRVETERGCVTLTGWVDTEKQRHAVDMLVGRMEGVVGVSNRLAVCEPPAADVAAQIAQTLSERLQREIESISVDTHDGVVTLAGTVGSLDEKRAACFAASQVQGVRQVVDRLGVA
ncbi:BON domain-containing protein [Paraburkholderia diazotrophica]|uniref:Osmotically-inducible protein OsmY, contains BON domain n=1 Tax=Paraburkholderia diazotrophica TaxID=667676 RepID=A0A1H7EGW0_9BURK|nr:BON domain-containing protein [Paraburkholderia diazotrophica]SEK10850.1 Osmotically-inducible protein OsmY, contains BON domain [Paraburkholderia diazotrophica]